MHEHTYVYTVLSKAYLSKFQNGKTAFQIATNETTKTTLQAASERLHAIRAGMKNAAAVVDDTA
jgi:hypothetical protein